MTLDQSDKISRLVRLARYAKGTRETARLAMDCFDLTSLKGNETKEEIHDICDIALHNGLASVCVYPEHVKAAHAVLDGGQVAIATVINFSDGVHRTQSDEIATPDTVKIDIEAALKNGARQMDIVFPRHHFDKGDFLKVKEILRAARKSCGDSVTLKCIFETASFNNAQDLRTACRIAIDQNIDCLKTSTGKHPSGGATLEAAAILLQEAQMAGRPVGVKISGGVKSNEDCAQYITLARGIRGHNSITPEFFRIGASSLIKDLIVALGPKSPSQVQHLGLENY